MAGNSPIAYSKVERASRRGGATCRNSGGSPFIWTYKSLSMSIPVHKNKVKVGYVNRARKLWYLLEKDGVSDKDFWAGNWPD